MKKLLLSFACIGLLTPAFAIYDLPAENIEKAKNYVQLKNLCEKREELFTQYTKVFGQEFIQKNYDVIKGGAAILEAVKKAEEQDPKLQQLKKDYNDCYKEVLNIRMQASNRIHFGEIKSGMTKDEAFKKGLREADEINHSDIAGVYSEQWVFRDENEKPFYVYFDKNNKVTGVQY